MGASGLNILQLAGTLILYITKDCLSLLVTVDGLQPEQNDRQPRELVRREGAPSRTYRPFACGLRARDEGARRSHEAGRTARSGRVRSRHLCSSICFHLLLYEYYSILFVPLHLHVQYNSICLIALRMEYILMAMCFYCIVGLVFCPNLPGGFLS